MSHKQIIIFFFFIILFAACKEECNTHDLSPGIYDNECSCENDGINFHGECIELNTNYSRYYGEFDNGDCNVGMLFEFDYLLKQINIYMYSYTFRPEPIKFFSSFENVGDQLYGGYIDCQNDPQETDRLTLYNLAVCAQDSMTCIVHFETHHRFDTPSLIESVSVEFNKL